MKALCIIDYDYVCMQNRLTVIIEMTLYVDMWMCLFCKKEQLELAGEMALFHIK